MTGNSNTGYLNVKDYGEVTVVFGDKKKHQITATIRSLNDNTGHIQLKDDEDNLYYVKDYWYILKEAP